MIGIQYELDLFVYGLRKKNIYSDIQAIKLVLIREYIGSKYVDNIDSLFADEMELNVIG